MAIRRLKVSNFRSFNELDVELGDFNVIIGANASGKSNFIEIFRFLRDIRKEGLRNALALQGGRHYVQNLRTGTAKPLSIDMTDVRDIGYGIRSTHVDGPTLYIHVNEMSYGFSLNFSAQSGRLHGDDWSIQHDSIMRDFTAYSHREIDDKTATENEVLGKLRFSAERDGTGLKRSLCGDPCLKGLLAQREDFAPLGPDWFPQDTLLLETRFFTLLLTGKLAPPFATIHELGIYRIDARASQQAQPVRALAELTEDATNLALILDRILANEEQRSSLINLVRFLLPFINDIGVRKFTEESLLIDMKEKYTGEKRIPASLISEGTIAAIALVVALYFEDRPLVIFEGPDRGMHPKLMARVVEMMKEVSKEKQIIITTHHPEMVRYAGVENLLLVSRDEDGFSQISRPADKEMVKRFLENDIGIDELYVDDLLEV